MMVTYQCFDGSGTLWRHALDEHKVGKRGLASDKIQDNLEPKKDKNGLIIRDKKLALGLPSRCPTLTKYIRNKDVYVRVARDSVKIIENLRKHHVALAIVSKNTNKEL